jgi:hypothetical protein
MSNHQSAAETQPVAPYVTGGPRILLRAEGAALLIAAALLYAETGKSWWLFIILFLVPDLSFLGYLGGARIGAIAYNTAHTLIGPLLLLVIDLFSPKQLLSIEIRNQLGLISLIWLAHIGFDRLVGYGLKYAAGFGFTHLGRVGRSSRKQS